MQELRRPQIDSIVGRLHWEACQECFWIDAKGECIRHIFHIDCDGEGEDLVCPRAEPESDFEEVDEEFRAKCDCRGQTTMFGVTPFTPTIFGKNGKYYVRKADVHQSP